MNLFAGLILGIIIGGAAAFIYLYYAGKLK